MPATYYLKELNILYRNKAGDSYPIPPDEVLHHKGWVPLIGQLSVSADAHPDMRTRGMADGSMDPLTWTKLSEATFEEAQRVARRRGLPTTGWEEEEESRLSAAFSFALELHGSQVRKQAEDERARPGIPYIAHLMSVAALVLEHGGNEDEAIAALLHDAPEDQGGRRTLEEIRQKFGKTVADIVAGCTDTFEDPKPPWRPRKEKYIQHLQESASPSVLLVSMADKTHNLRAILGDYRRIGEKLWKRFTGRKDGTLWYYGALLEVYREKAPSGGAALVEEMERMYEELTDLART